MLWQCHAMSKHSLLLITGLFIFLKQIGFVQQGTQSKHSEIEIKDLKNDLGFLEPKSGVGPAVKSMNERKLWVGARAGEALAMVVSIQAFPSPIFRFD